MTPEIMWSLVIALGAIAVAAVLDFVKHRRELHLANEELSSSRKQFDSLKQQHEQAVSNLKKLNAGEKLELAEVHKKEINNFHSQISILKKKAGDASVTGGAGGQNGDGGSVTIIGGTIKGGDA